MNGLSPERQAFIVIAVVALVAGALVGFYYDRFWFPPDEGNYAHVAERIVEGEVLHHDVQDVHPGYINHVNAMSLRLFGTRMVSMRYPLAVISILQAVLVSVLLLRQGWVASVVGGIASVGLGVLFYLNPSANWYALFFTVVLVAWLQWVPKGRWRLLGAGLILGIIGAFRQLSGGIIGIGLITWLLIEPAAPRVPQPERAKPGLLAVGIWLAGLCILLAYILSAAGLVSIVLFGMWAPLIHVVAGREIQRSSRDALQISCLLLVGILLAFTPILLEQIAAGGLGPWWSDVVYSAFSLARLELPSHYSWSTWLLAASVGGFLAGFPGPLIGGAMLLLFFSVAVLGLDLIIHRRQGIAIGSFGPAPFLAVYVALVPLHFPSLIYLAFSLPMIVLGLLSLPRQNVRAIVVASILPVAVFWLAAQPGERSLLQVVAGDREPWVQASGLDRLGLLVSPSSATDWARLVELLHETTSPEDAIFVFPSHAELYFLAERRNPTRFFNSALGLPDSAAVEELLSGFEDDPPAAIVYDAENFGYASVESDRVLDWVRTNYVRVDSVRRMILFLPDRELD